MSDVEQINMKMVGVIKGHFDQSFKYMNDGGILDALYSFEEGLRYLNAAKIIVPAKSAELDSLKDKTVQNLKLAIDGLKQGKSGPLRRA